VHETTRGPFRPSDNMFPQWPPDEKDPAAVANFLETLQLTLNCSTGGPRRRS
jgi:hypothetical protein